MRKRVFGQMRSPRSASGPSLSANRIIGYYKMYEWREKVRTILCSCAGWPESANFAHVWRHLFAWRGLFVKLPLVTPSGNGFIWLLTILLCSALMLNGSTVKGKFPVSIAYIFTPLEWETMELSTFSSLGKISSDSILKMCFLFFQKINSWHFMQIFSLGDNMHKDVSKPIFWVK